MFGLPTHISFEDLELSQQAGSLYLALLRIRDGREWKSDRPYLKDFGSRVFSVITNQACVIDYRRSSLADSPKGFTLLGERVEKYFPDIDSPLRYLAVTLADAKTPGRVEQDLPALIKFFASIEENPHTSRSPLEFAA